MIFQREGELSPTSLFAVPLFCFVCNGGLDFASYRRNFSLLSDDSGRWGRGGLFTALEKRSAEPRKVYELAGKMKGKEPSREKG